MELKDAYAFHDTMPGKEHTSRVGVTVVLERADYFVGLVRHEPPGINPRDLIIDVEVRPATGGASGPVDRPAELDLEPDELADVDTVTFIQDGGPSLTVDVTPTS